MSNQLDHLIQMINQIAENNRAYEEHEAAERVANHIKRFWARTMKADLAAYYQSGGQALDPVARQATELLGLDKPDNSTQKADASA